MTEITLEFIGRQLERLIGDVANLRDDVTVLTAICVRLETQMEAHHRQFARMNDRVRKLEDRVNP